MTTPGVDARRYLGGAVELVGFARPRGDEVVCGDAFGWRVTPEIATLLVVDGLGHGPPAREAAVRAVESVLEAPELPADQLLRRCHAALIRTRGAAVAIVQVDTARMRLLFCGVGNVRIWETPSRGGRGTSIPGIVGLRLPSLRVFESALHSDDLLLFHTDGVPSGFESRHLRDVPFEDVPQSVTRRHGLPHDDATVVALRARATA
ncbi:MAG: Anti-sigma factor RsbT / Phosphoserine phosphatase RsbX [Labilithrix sp.]|nr:Anti-sigma factor RsbT / Phosphoserine phosphatase RsbX [Labilithrix sp.]